MYAIVATDEVLAFGLTPRQAMEDFARRASCCYYGPTPEVYSCSPELYRQLEAVTSDDILLIPCRVDSDGVAVPRQGRDSRPQSK